MFLLNFRITYQNAPEHVRENFPSQKQRNSLMKQYAVKLVQKDVLS